MKALKTKYEKYLKELERLNGMYEYEKKYYGQGLNLIAGIDEAGRGPLCGPVVAAAVILPKGSKIIGVNDSKKLSETKRNELYKIIKHEAVSIGIGIVPPHVIDEINILQATFRAMSIAVENLKIIPDCVLVDGNAMPPINIPGEAIIKGDSKSISVAAASVVAKVTRDNIMLRLSERYPEYGFEKNKGYGTKEHINAINEYGLCPIHRISFISHKA